jgi:hypothetical protein
VVSIRGLHLGGADCRLQALGIQLPTAPTPFGTYVETVQAGNLLFFSGMLPVVDHEPKYLGRLGKELDAEAGRDAAYNSRTPPWQSEGRNCPPTKPLTRSFRHFRYRKKRTQCCAGGRALQLICFPRVFLRHVQRLVPRASDATASMAMPASDAAVYMPTRPLCPPYSPPRLRPRV